MTTQIEERNRAFAKFLGATYAPESDEFEMYGIIDTIEDGENEKHFFKPSEMPFDTDYNWIMAVCNKIISLGFTLFIGELYSRITYYENIYFIIESGDAKNNKEAILEVCIHFINLK